MALAQKSPRKPATKGAAVSFVPMSIRLRFENSYVPKKIAVAGIEPAIAGVTPAYSPLSKPSSRKIAR